MSTRSSMHARAGLVALSVLMAACAKQEKAAAPPALQKQKHDVKIGEKEHPPGEFTGIPDVDPVVIKPYNPAAAGAHVVIWTYKHKWTSIHIDGVAETLQPACPTTEKTCTWEVPTGLLSPDEKSKKFKYTITGKHDDLKSLKPNDPEIEIDR